MKCKNCGHHNQASIVACDRCGHRLVYSYAQVDDIGHTPKMSTNPQSFEEFNSGIDDILNDTHTTRSSASGVHQQSFDKNDSSRETISQNIASTINSRPAKSKSDIKAINKQNKLARKNARNKVSRDGDDLPLNEEARNSVSTYREDSRNRYSTDTRNEHLNESPYFAAATKDRIDSRPHEYANSRVDDRSNNRQDDRINHNQNRGRVQNPEYVDYRPQQQYSRNPEYYDEPAYASASNNSRANAYRDEYREPAYAGASHGSRNQGYAGDYREPAYAGARGQVYDREPSYAGARNSSYVEMREPAYAGGARGGHYVDDYREPVRGGHGRYSGHQGGSNQRPQHPHSQQRPQPEPQPKAQVADEEVYYDDSKRWVANIALGIAIIGWIALFVALAFKLDLGTFGIFVFVVGILGSCATVLALGLRQNLIIISVDIVLLVQLIIYSSIMIWAI